MFKHILNSWSTYQIVTMILMFVLILAIILFVINFLTKQKTYLLFTLTSFLSSAILTVLAFLIINILFKLTISYIFLLTPIVVLIVNLIHIGMSVGYYTNQRMQKHPDSYKLKKEFLKDSFQVSIFIVLLLISFLLYLSNTAFTFILLTGIVTISMTWINYLLLSLFFRNNE